MLSCLATLSSLEENKLQATIDSSDMHLVCVRAGRGRGGSVGGGAAEGEAWAPPRSALLSLGRAPVQGHARRGCTPCSQ
eukprot:1225192-Rhodomonas_salina.1